MSHSQSALVSWVITILPFTLSAQYNQIQNVAQGTGEKNSLAISDINGDGNPDLVIGGSRAIYWTPNDAGTGFLAPQIIQQQGRLQAIGDLDGDGDPDLVCSRYEDNDLAWYRNDGQGGFSFVTSWATGQYFTCIELADLDGDNDLDVVAKTGKILWYENADGAGTLLNEHIINPSGDEVWMKPMDLDSDGDLDLVYNSFNYTRWMPNLNGLGTSWGTEQIIINQLAGNAVMADIDADGLKDLVMCASSSDLIWLKRNSTGFNPHTKLLPGDTASVTNYLCVGDPDADGDVDVVGSSPSQLLFYRNNGGGSFNKTVLDSKLESVKGLLFGDIDLDGEDDLVAANHSPEKVVWYPNTGGAQFGSPRCVSTEFREINDLALADLDLDGDLDVIGSNYKVNQVPLDNQLTWYENQGSLFPRQHVMAFGLGEFIKVKPVDIDGDNDPDLLALSRKPLQICWFENDGAGRFDSVHTIFTTLIAVSHSSDLEPNDLDLDGDLDFIVTYGTKMAWFENTDGAGTFGPQQTLFTGLQTYQAAVLDWNGDAAPDIAFSEGFNADLLVLYADSVGHYSDNISNWGYLSNQCFLQTADFDGDGKADLASNGGGELWVRLSNNSFDKIILAKSPYYSGYQLAVADVDMDGDQDLLSSSHSSQSDSIVWYENADGQGNFNPPLVVIVEDLDSAPEIACGDLDGDGDPDIVFEKIEGSSAQAEVRVDWIKNEVAGSRIISGQCFWDLNANAVPDSGEVGLQFLPVQISPLPKALYSDADGKFRFYVPPGEFELNFQPHICQQMTTPTTQIVNTLAGSVDSVFFGVQYNADSSGLRSWLFSSPTRCNSFVSFHLVLENTGCEVESGTVSLQLSDLATYHEAFPQPQIITADSLVWDFQNISPDNHQQIQVTFQIAGAEHLGDSVLMQVLTRTTTGGLHTARKPFTYSSSIICAYDPNDKQVLPARGSEHHVFAGEELTYTIRFQNTGTDTAFSIVIRDQLAPELDWSTLRPLTASHPFTTQLSETGLLEFFFDNIQLPDSNVNQAGSQGYVSFLIHLRDDVPLYSLIGNHADIYFDQNIPILTNTVNVLRQDPISAIQTLVSEQEFIQVYPNPFSESLDFQWQRNSESGMFRIEVWDMTQRLVGFKRLPAGDNGQIELQDLPNGMYLYRFVRETDGKTVGVGKVVKI